MYNNKELRTLSIDELNSELVKARKELLAVKMQVRTGQSKTHHQVQELKKNIARILTHLNERKNQSSDEKAE